MPDSSSLAYGACRLPAHFHDFGKRRLYWQRGIGNTNADPTINGGMVSNNTGLGVSANGGTAISDASGGSYNLAFVS